MIGSKIDGKYLVISLLGQGGMGSVYEAEHTATGRRCAVKVINSGDLTKDKQVLSRFEREARAAGAIDTQHITQVLDAGIDRESQLPFMAMEYLDGEDLQHLLKRVGPVSPDLTMRVVAQTCLGLKKAHDAKVVHRDIKPHNLFLAERDAGEVIVKLLDFGIAKVKMEQAQTAEGADLTRTGNLLGSPLYVSPEQARGKRDIDHRTDLYSLGAVMYQMLCGRTPYEHATALGELILMICTEPPAPVQDFAPWCPPALAEIVHKCLRKVPDERYQDAEEIFTDIKKLLGNSWTVNKEMLISLADSQRAELAPRASVSEPPPADLVSGTYGTVAGITGAAATSADASLTTGAIVHSAKGAESPSKLPMVAVASLVVVLAGGGVWAITKGNQQAAISPPETTAPAPAETSQQPAAPPPAPVIAEKNTYRIPIRPPDAKVFVDKKPVEVFERTNGDSYFELAGRLGDSFQVVVKGKGIDETSGIVAVLKTGVDPAFFYVEEGKGAVKVQPQHRAGPKPTSTPKATPKPPAPTGIDTSEDDFND